MNSYFEIAVQCSAMSFTIHVNLTSYYVKEFERERMHRILCLIVFTAEINIKKKQIQFADDHIDCYLLSERQREENIS